MKFKFKISIILISILYLSCTKYGDPAPYIQDNTGDSISKIKARKVLLINIDGLGGTTLKNLNPTNIASLLTHSKYNFSTYQGDTLTEPAAWQTLLTGVSFYAHQIGDSTWIVPPSDDIEDERPYYLSFIERLLQTKPRSKSYAVSPWNILVNNGGFLYANKYQLTSNDKETNDSLNSQLKGGTSDLYIAEFNGYALEGVKSGFKSTTSMSVINSIDKYIGDCVSTIKSRTNYADEEWLIILNSQFGGDGNTYSEDGFRIMYNDKLSRQEVSPNGYISTTFYANDSNKTGFLYDTSYSIGTGEFTMSFNILSSATSSYPSLISKNSSLTGAGGWTFFGNGGDKKIEARFYNTNGAQCRFQSGASVTDGKWHNITFVVAGSGSARNISFYIDGVLDNANSSYPQPRPAPNFNLSNNTIPITLGAWQGNVSSGVAASNFNNIKIYRKALSSSEVAAQVNQKDITSDPNYNLIIGFWKCNDGHKNEFRNSISGKSSFILGKSLSWNAITPAPNGFIVGNTSSFSIDPDNKDIAPNIFKWLRADINNSWGWPNSWITYFEYEYGVE